jgi:integrase
VRAKHVLERQQAFAVTPRKADHLVSMLSTIISWGIPRDYAEVNPCAKIEKISGGDGWMPWQQEDIDYARTQIRADLWHAAALALYTGQRQSDVLTMDWKRIAAGEISVRQDKTGKFLWIPLHRELRAVLDAVPKLSTRILTNSRGVPWSSGFKAAWQEAMNAPGLLHLPGAEAGLPRAQEERCGHATGVGLHRR